MGSVFSSASEEGVVECEVVSPINVYNALNDTTSYFIVLDLRSEMEYIKSHIDLAANASTLESLVSLTQESSYTTVIMYGSYSTLPRDKVLVNKFCTEMNKYRIKKKEGVLKVLYLHEFNDFYNDYTFQCTNTVNYEEGRLYPSQITDNIFLSNFGVASSRKVTHTLGVTHVLNCTKDCPFVGEKTDTADSFVALESAFNFADVSTAMIPSTNDNTTTKKAIDLPQNEIKFHRVPVVDEKDQQIHEHFGSAVKFLSSMSLHDKAIIHCKHGQSRSATVAAAFLIHKFGWDVDTALNHLKSCRPKVCPNEGFVTQLHLYFNQLHRSNDK